MPAAKKPAPKKKEPVTGYLPEIRCGLCHSKMYWPDKSTVACPKLGCKNRGVRCKIPHIELERV